MCRIHIKRFHVFDWVGYEFFLDIWHSTASNIRLRKLFGRIIRWVPAKRQIRLILIIIKFTQPQIYMMSQESCSFLWCDYIKMEKTFWTYLNFRSQNWTQRILISRCAESREPTSNITLREKSNKKENWGKRERNDW